MTLLFSCTDRRFFDDCFLSPLYVISGTWNNWNIERDLVSSYGKPIKFHIITSKWYIRYIKMELYDWTICTSVTNLITYDNLRLNDTLDFWHFLTLIICRVTSNRILIISTLSTCLANWIHLFSNFKPRFNYFHVLFINNLVCKLK